ncbi:MAG: YicC family protein [Ignavibacteria bacterium]|nr:YicC family protein [Ignavibacteria bacterium]
MKLSIATGAPFSYFSALKWKFCEDDLIASMTGYGRGAAQARGVTATVELRGVNSRFLEVVARVPRSLSLRENDIKEIVRKTVTRGKVNILAAIERENGGELGLRINASAAKSYLKLLGQLKKAAKIREPIRLDHLLRFSEVLEGEEVERADETEWEVFRDALQQALGLFVQMRANEGAELKKDFEARLAMLEQTLTEIEALTREQVPQERVRLRERVDVLMNGESVDEGRLELELALLADRLDVTEECVRFHSHNKFFLAALEEEAAGRKLNFLVQEMNREANTIGSKSSSVEIAHRVVRLKEELERIREQLQNIE